jgi:hypothetical protein
LSVRWPLSARRVVTAGAHARATHDAAEVLSIAWDVYSYMFRDEVLPVAGLDQIGPPELRILREAATLMALNKVELDGTIGNVGPCWFFPAATSVVFDLSEETGGMTATRNRP